MSDPVRLLERLDTLPAELQNALGGAPGSPQPAELQQLAERLSGALGLPLGASLAAPVSASVPTAFKLLSALLVGAALGTGGSALLSTLGSAPAPAPSRAPAPDTTTAAASPSPARSANVDEEPAPSSAVPGSSSGLRDALRAAAPAVEASAPQLRVESELLLVERAQRALRRDPAVALSLSGEHAALFPSGNLAQEREVIAIEALLRLTQPRAARERAQRFESTYPASAHARRLRELLEKYGAEP